MTSVQTDGYSSGPLTGATIYWRGSYYYSFMWARGQSTSDTTNGARGYILRASLSNNKLAFNTIGSQVITTVGSSNYPPSVGVKPIPGLKTNLLLLNCTARNLRYLHHWIFDTNTNSYYSNALSLTQSESLPFYYFALSTHVVAVNSGIASETAFYIYSWASSTASITSYRATKPANTSPILLGGVGNTLYLLLMAASTTVSATSAIAKYDLTSGSYSYEIIPNLHTLTAIVQDGTTITFRAQGTNGYWTSQYIRCDLTNLTSSFFSSLSFTISNEPYNYRAYVGDYAGYSYWITSENADANGPLWLERVNTSNLTFALYSLNIDRFPIYGNINQWMGDQYGACMKKTYSNSFSGLLPFYLIVVDVTNYRIYPLNPVLTGARNYINIGGSAFSITSLFSEYMTLYGTDYTKNHALISPMENAVGNYYFYSPTYIVGGKPKYIYLNKEA